MLTVNLLNNVHQVAFWNVILFITQIVVVDLKVFQSYKRFLKLKLIYCCFH